MLHCFLYALHNKINKINKIAFLFFVKSVPPIMEMIGPMEVELLDDFWCPISLEVMTNPVILTSGHTFDRASIQRWLDMGNRTYPVTNLPLPPSPTLIPNHALRHLIQSNSPTSPLPLPSSQQQPCGVSSSSSSPLNLILLIPSPCTLSSFYRCVKSSAQFRRLAMESGAVLVLLRQEVALRLR